MSNPIWPGRALLVLTVIGSSPWLRADDRPSVPPDHARRMREGQTLFREKVRPVIVRACLDCHGGKATKGNLDLSDRKPLLESGVLEGGRRIKSAGCLDPALRKATHAGKGSEAGG